MPQGKRKRKPPKFHKGQAQSKKTGRMAKDKIPMSTKSLGMYTPESLGNPRWTTKKKRAT